MRVDMLSTALIALMGSALFASPTQAQDVAGELRGRSTIA